MENLKKLVGEDVYKQHIEPKLGADKKYFFGEGDFIPKGRFDENNTSLKQQIADRDKQLAELKKTAVGNEELTAKLKALEDVNKQQTADYEAKLHQQEYDFNFDKLLNGANAKDTKILATLIDKEKLTYKDGQFTGFKEQVEAVKKTHPYIFAGEQQTPPVRTGGPNTNPALGKQTEFGQQQQTQPWNKSPYRR